MNCLHLAPGHDLALGGSIRHMRLMSEGLAARGASVRLWASTVAEGTGYWMPSTRHLPAGASVEGGVEVELFPPRYLPSHWRAARLLGCAWPPLRPWIEPPGPYLPSLMARARSPEPWPDIVHATCFPMDSVVWAGRLIARRLGVPFVITPLVHSGTDSGDEHFRRFYQRPWQIRCLRDAAAVLVLSETEGRVVAGCGVGPERIITTGSGLDVGSLPTPEPARFRGTYGISEPFVLHIANLSPEKGTLDLVEAARMLHQRRRDAPDLVLIGSPSPQVTDRLRGHDWCHLLGRVDEQTKHDALAACEVFCLPSRADAFGIVFLEAWAHRRPVIGARAGGIGDLLSENDAGVLVEFGDIGALADAIECVLADPSDLGRRGHDLLHSRYTARHLVDRVEGVYKSLLSPDTAAGRPATGGGP